MRSAVLLAFTSIWAFASVGLVTACGDSGGPADPVSTPIPTATPLATLPRPTLVTSAATPAATPVAGEEVTYIVVAGDALSLIAERFGVPAAEIAALNNLEGSNVFVGQRLRIPRPAAGSGAAAGKIVYTVVAGDALSLIAERFGVPAAEIAQLNNLAGSSVIIGQTLRIPRPAPGGTPGATPAPSTSGVTTYTVEAGDSAFGIALQFDVTLEALERANGAGPGRLDRLQVGQVLKLPPRGR